MEIKVAAMEPLVWRVPSTSKGGPSDVTIADVAATLPLKKEAPIVVIVIGPFGPFRVKELLVTGLVGIPLMRIVSFTAASAAFFFSIWLAVSIVPFRFPLTSTMEPT